MITKQQSTFEKGIFALLLDQIKSLKRIDDRYEGGVNTDESPYLKFDENVKNPDLNTDVEKNENEEEEPMPPMPLVVKFLLTIGFL